MGIAPWGWPAILWTTFLSAGMGWLLWSTPVFWPVAVVLLLIIAYVLAFFRNPSRQAPPGAHRLLSPADGLVADITTVESTEWLDEPAVRIGVFMSLFDVHVNRAPADAVIRYKQHRPGKFLDVRHPDASQANEAMSLGLELQDGQRILMRQLAGLVARRIVCPPGEGDRLERGTVFGMIRFGSRLELWIPVSRAHTVLVREGQRVKTGETVLVDLGEASR